MMALRTGVTTALVFLALACRDRPADPPDITEVFRHLPLPPSATLVSSSGGVDALQLTMVSPSTMEQVTEYYRAILSKEPWRLVNEAKASGGGTVLLAEANGRPLWITLRRTGEVTRIELAGAIPAGPDTAKAAAKPSS